MGYLGHTIPFQDMKNIVVHNGLSKIAQEIRHIQSLCFQSAFQRYQYPMLESVAALHVGCSTRFIQQSIEFQGFYEIDWWFRLDEWLYCIPWEWNP